MESQRDMHKSLENLIDELKSINKNDYEIVSIETGAQWHPGSVDEVNCKITLTMEYNRKPSKPEYDNEEMLKKKLEKLRLEKTPSPNNTMIISPHKCPICDYYLYVDGAGRSSKKEHYCLNCGFTTEIDEED